jgi:uncharacterized protein DUF6328
VAGLHGKVKNGLDEARMLVLGAQVLLGFQFRGFFEKAYDNLSPAESGLQLAALFALLITVAALFLIAARHRIVEQGHATTRFHRFTMAVMRFVLLPFALGLSFDLGIAGNRIGGAWTGAASGAFALVAALAFWYGPFALRGRHKRAEPEHTMEDTPLEQRIVEVLTEARVLLPGAQALLGSAQVVHLVSLGFVALATIVLMAPAAYHRIVERGQDTERFHDFASKMLLLALALFGPGFSGDMYVVLRRAGHGDAALPVAAATLLVFYGAWFGAMFLLRRRHAPALRGRTA